MNVPNRNLSLGNGVAVVTGCLALGALSLLIPSAPTTDPWGWLVWGREILHLRLDTVVPGAPSWKPLPVLVTTPLALAGPSAPTLWLLVERAAAFASLLVAYRLAARLGGRTAGVVAVAGLVLSAHWLRELAHGYTEPLSIGLLLASVDAHLSGHHRRAIGLGALLALARPETWLVLAAYALVVPRRQGPRPLVLAGVLAAIPALWLIPDWIGSGDPFHGGKVARTVGATGSEATFHALREAATIVPLPWSVAAAAGLALALRGRDRVVLEIAALTLAWATLVTAMMLAGYPASARYFALPSGLLCVMSGVGAVKSVQAIHRSRPRVAMALVLVLAALPLIALRAEAIGDEARATVTRATFESDLRAAAAEAVSGPGRCGAPVLPRGLMWAKGAVAWELGLPLEQVRGLHTSVPGFIARLSAPSDEPMPYLGRGRLVEVHAPGRRFLLLEPFGRARVRLIGRPLLHLESESAVGPWRAETAVGEGCGRRRGEGLAERHRWPPAGRRLPGGFDDEPHLVDEAPRPVLARLQRADDRVLVGGRVLARVAVR